MQENAKLSAHPLTARSNFLKEIHLFSVGRATISEEVETPLCFSVVEFIAFLGDFIA